MEWTLGPITYSTPLTMARLQRTAHAAVDWALGSERISLCHSAWHAAMCGMMKPREVCVCVKLRPQVLAPTVPRARGDPISVSPDPTGGWWLSPPNLRGDPRAAVSPPCCSALWFQTVRSAFSETKCQWFALHFSIRRSAKHRILENKTSLTTSATSASSRPNLTNHT